MATKKTNPIPEEKGVPKMKNPPAPPKKKAPTKISIKQKEELEKQKQELFQKRIDEIIVMISDEGFSLRKSLKINKMSSETFFEEIERNPNNAKRYARACTQRADAIFEEVFDIADDNSGDTTTIFNRNGDPIEVEDKEWTSRAKLRIDVRKWAAAKLNPKKYGERIELAGDQENPIAHVVLSLGTGIKPPEDE